MAAGNPYLRACDSISCNDSEQLEQLQLEMADLQQEIQRFKSLLKEVESDKKSLEDELQRLNQKALGFLSENQTLHNKLQVAEVSQRQAQSAERDHEEGIHLLKAEIVERKTRLTGTKTKQASEAESDVLELKRRLSLADGQLRKSEITWKRLELYNRKLLLFAQNAHQLLSMSSALPEGKRADSQADEDKTGRTSDAPLPPSKFVDLLIAEAKELLEPILLSNTTRDAIFTTRQRAPLLQAKAATATHSFQAPPKIPLRTLDKSPALVCSYSSSCILRTRIFCFGGRNGTMWSQ
ncbi:syntaxin-binding protein 4-like isoform X2 [Rhineura floridana]|nr:syntaxin-binding protein 4-like isoform X2 [Rhineura floridana]